jgi:hypothetical protein
MATVEVARFRVGERVVCPKCGQPGVVAIERVGAKGHRYAYIAVRHYGPPDWKARKCYIARVEGGAAPAKPVTPRAAVNQREPVETRERAETPKPAPSVPEPRVDEREFDRVAWYITKFNIAWGAVRTAPSEETYQAFVSVAKQVADRVGVDTSTAVAAVTKFYAERSKDAVIAATTAVKEVVKAMVAKMAQVAEVPSKPVEAPRPVVDIDEIRSIVREEVERAVNAVFSEIASRMMEREEIEEVVVDRVTYDIVQRVFRGKHKTSQEERAKAYEVWDRIFKEGKKIVDVRRQPS